MEGGGLEGAGAGLHGLVRSQGLREAGLSQELAAAPVEGAQEELLGLAVLDVKVPRGASEAGGGPDGLEATGLVAGALEEGLVHEALDEEDGVPMALGPVVAEAAEGECEDAGGEVGEPLAVREDEEAGVVDDQVEAAGALARGPADPLVAGLDVEGGAGEEEDGDGLVVDEGDVAEGGSCDVGLVEVVVLGEASVELLALVGLDEADDDAGEEVGFRRGLGGAHAPESWGRHLSFAQVKDDVRQAGDQELVPDESALATSAERRATSDERRATSD